MSEKQKANRPKIEDIIGSLLDGDNLKNALDFIVYLRKNKMNPQWGSGNSWKVSYKSKGICYIRAGGGFHICHNLDNSSWHINFITVGHDFSQGYEKFIPNDGTNDIVFANVKHCRYGSTCAPGDKVTVLEREFENICRHSHIVIKNPNIKVLECAKKLIEYRRNTIINKTK